MRFHIIVHGLIKKGNQYLFIRRCPNAKFAPNLWDSPGGSLELGESPEEGIIRETKEETGLEIKIVGPIAVYSKIVADLDKQFVTIIYLCEYLNGVVDLNEEHTEYRWLSMQELNQIALVDYLVDATQKI